MPKVIQNVDSMIKECAKELFIKKSYPAVDMKMISVQSKIAVGTIYHYYKNKLQLYFCVLNESWEETFVKLSEIDAYSNGPEEKRNRLITTLYYDVKDRNGLGKALIYHSDEELTNSSYYSELKVRLLSIVSDIISKSAANRLSIDNACKQAEALLSSILAMIEFHPNDDEDNIEFLNSLFNTSK